VLVNPRPDLRWVHDCQTVNKGAVTTMAADRPTIVFVHGAWADASGFGG
jgi:hypothetical protein